ncbi:glycogen synthase [Mycobacterium sp. NPDC003449]
MRVAMMTREYPPEVYGGAGVHVTELVAQLRHLCEVDVHCMGAPRDGAVVAQPDPALRGANPALSTLSADLSMVNTAAQATVVHSHTWYAGMAGHLTGLLYGIPHVLTAHSLEPLRPWKAEQLGGGYRVSSWVERTAIEAADAVIAVSAGMRADVLRTYPALDPGRVHVVRNGIDTTVWYPGPPVEGESVLAELGVDPNRPIVAFVGRITRQKGVAHLVAAAHRFSPDVQLVLCAGAPDTPEIAAEVSTAVGELASARTGVFWVREMLPIPKIREILSAATVFVCPSVYEPLGIVNLEAMACATAVVASDVGGIPEVVADHRTGLLVHYDAGDPESFETSLADAVNSLVADPGAARTYGHVRRGHPTSRSG